MSLLEPDAYSLDEAAEKFGISRGNLEALIRARTVNVAVFIDQGTAASFLNMTPSQVVCWLAVQWLKRGEIFCNERFAFIGDDFGGETVPILPKALAIELVNKAPEFQSKEHEREWKVKCLMEQPEYVEAEKVVLNGYYSIDSSTATTHLDSDTSRFFSSGDIRVLGLDGRPFCSYEELHCSKVGDATKMFHSQATLMRFLSNGDGVVSRLYVTRAEIQRVKRLDSQQKSIVGNSEKAVARIDQGAWQAQASVESFVEALPSGIQKAIRLYQECWEELPVNMKTPSKTELEYQAGKLGATEKTFIEALIKLSVPDSERVGGKQKAGRARAWQVKS